MKKIFTLLLSCAVSFTAFNASAQSLGSLAPDFTLNKLGGGQFKLSDHSGKVVFIFFFGYACPHCISNGPNTESGIYDVYKNNSDFVAVGIDTWDGNESGVTNFRSTTGVSYPLCLMGSPIQKLYETTYDRIFIIDKEGIIRYKATADATSAVVDQASDVIKKYLSGDGGMDGMGGDGGGTVTATEDPEEESEVKIYPVPVGNQLTVEMGGLATKSGSVKIIDALGKTVLENHLDTTDKFSFPIDQLEDGVYFLQLALRDEVILKKFLVRR